MKSSKKPAAKSKKEKNDASSDSDNDDVVVDNSDDIMAMLRSLKKENDALKRQILNSGTDTEQSGVDEATDATKEVHSEL